MITFGRLTDFTKKLNEIKRFNLLFYVLDTNTSKEYILFLNRIEQIFNEGVDIEGNIMGVYARSTEIIQGRESFKYGNSKTKRKTAGEPYFLIDSSQLFDSFDVTINQNEFTIQARTIKEGEDLIAKFGEFIGLTNESEFKLISYLIPQLQIELLNFLLNA